MMKNAIRVALVTLTFIFPASIMAGMVVSDPTSYSYYVEQIKQSVKNFEELQKQLETAKGTYNEIQDMKSQLIGTYDSAVGLVDDLRGFKQELEDNPTAMLKYAEKFLSQELQEDEYIDPQVIMDDVFVDPRETKDPIDKLKDLHKKYHVRQASLEEAIKSAEKTVQTTPEKLQKISELAGKIDTTENIKAAMDLNNLLLTEILKTLTDLVRLSAQIGEAQALQSFHGVDTAQTEQLEKDLEKHKSKRCGYRPMQEYRKEKGLGDNYQQNMKKLLTF